MFEDVCGLKGDRCVVISYRQIRKFARQEERSSQLIYGFLAWVPAREQSRWARKYWWSYRLTEPRAGWLATGSTGCGGCSQPCRMSRGRAQASHAPSTHPRHTHTAWLPELLVVKFALWWGCESTDRQLNTTRRRASVYVRYFLRISHLLWMWNSVRMDLLPTPRSQLWTDLRILNNP